MSSSATLRYGHDHHNLMVLLEYGFFSLEGSCPAPLRYAMDMIIIIWQFVMDFGQLLRLLEKNIIFKKNYRIFLTSKMSLVLF